MQYSIGEIASIADGEVSGSTDRLVSHLVTDSRKILDPAASLFFALRGERDGHHFISEAIQRGVCCFVVDKIPEEYQSAAASFILVDNTLEALQKLAAHHRRKFKYPVIGLTGSNGKTMVKEWINHLLHEDLQIIRSPRSYNSQIGVPLSIWQMQPGADLAIIEAGISKMGEMESLEKMIRPEIGIFTNIGEAHSEGFTSRQAKIREKLILFQHSEVLIYCNDYKDLSKEVEIFQQQHGTRILDWGSSENSTVLVDDVLVNDNSTFIRLRYQSEIIGFSIPFTGVVPVENAITCAVVLLWLNKTTGLARNMQTLPALSMRLEMKNGINRSTVINDSYSNDLSSLKLALDFLQQQRQHTRKSVILSDIPQTKIPLNDLYGQVAALLKQHQIDKLRGIGPAISSYAEAFRKEGIDVEFWVNTDDFIHHFNPLLYRDEIILIKGGRSFGFERINQLLEVKMHQTVLTINLSSIAENLTTYRKMIEPGTRIMVMVKAFSYGSGSFEIANLLQFHKVDHLAVAYADEGVDLRKAGISIPIMVMNPEMSSFASIVNYDLHPEIFSFQILEEFNAYLQQEGITEYPVHIKFNTGMNRLGFEPGEVEKLGQKLLSLHSLRVVSVFTHLTSSEDPGDDRFTVEQGKTFIQCCVKLESQLGYSFYRHIANTAAILRHPYLQLDMVRLGIGLYGVNVTDDQSLLLREAAVLTTTIAQVRKVAAGETIGYNRKGRLNRDSIIATIRIGYADGYPRTLGNGVGQVMIRNRLFPVVGSVCMDMTMVDVTDIPDISTEDEVVVFGRGLSLNQLANWAGTIPYDIMTGISQRVKRVYIED